MIQFESCSFRDDMFTHLQGCDFHSPAPLRSPPQTARPHSRPLKGQKVTVLNLLSWVTGPDTEVEQYLSFYLHSVQSLKQTPPPLLHPRSGCWSPPHHRRRHPLHQSLIPMLKKVKKIEHWNWHIILLHIPALLQIHIQAILTNRSGWLSSFQLPVYHVSDQTSPVPKCLFTVIGKPKYCNFVV